MLKVSNKQHKMTRLAKKTQKPLQMQHVSLIVTAHTSQAPTKYFQLLHNIQTLIQWEPQAIRQA
jgi:hypothetical protein